MSRLERAICLGMALLSALVPFAAAGQGFPISLRVVIWVLAPVAFLGFLADAFSYDFSITVKWYDIWVGAYVDRSKRTLYICPFPCLLLTFQPAPGTAEGRTERG